MPCPVAPLLGLLPAILGLPLAVAHKIRGKKKAENARLSSEHVAEARAFGIELTEQGSASIKLSGPQLNTFEFYRDRVPHIRTKKASFRDSVNTTSYLLFDTCASRTLAAHLAAALADVGASYAKVRDDELKVAGLRSDTLRAHDIKKLCEAVQAIRSQAS